MLLELVELSVEENGWLVFEEVAVGANDDASVVILFVFTVTREPGAFVTVAVELATCCNVVVECVCTAECALVVDKPLVTAAVVIDEEFVDVIPNQ